MKIFLTGATRRHCLMQTKPVIDMWNEAETFYQALTAMGHDVEVGSVEPGHEIRGFDAILCYLVSPRSMTSKFGPGMIWAMRYAADHGIPLLTFFGDWDQRIVYSGFRAIATHGPKELDRKLAGQLIHDHDHDLVMKHADAIVETSQWFIDWPSPLWDRAVCFYFKMAAFGDPEIMARTTKRPGFPMRWADPTPVLIDRYGLEFYEGEKTREWGLAALGKWDEWVAEQKITWPVHKWGPKRFGLETLRREEDVIQAYQGTWGILSPDRYNAGGGDYRMRTLYAPFTRSILYAGKTDNDMLGGPFRNQVHEIESLTPRGLDVLAREQRMWMADRLEADEDVFYEQLQALIDEAVEKASVG